MGQNRYKLGLTMKYKSLRVRITEELYKEFKHICVEMNLSLPKQNAELIKNFVMIQKQNQKRLNK